MYTMICPTIWKILISLTPISAQWKRCLRWTYVLYHLLSSSRHVSESPVRFYNRQRVKIKTQTHPPLTAWERLASPLNALQSESLADRSNASYRNQQMILHSKCMILSRLHENENWPCTSWNKDCHRKPNSLAAPSSAKVHQMSSNGNIRIINNQVLSALSPLIRLMI